MTKNDKKKRKMYFKHFQLTLKEKKRKEKENVNSYRMLKCSIKKCRSKCLLKEK